MVYYESVAVFLQMLDFLFEVLVAVYVDLVKLILVDEVLSYISEILIGCSIKFGGVGEEESTFFEGKSAVVLESVCGFDLFDGILEEIVNNMFWFESCLLNKLMDTYSAVR